MNHELVHHVLQKRQIPAPAPHLFDLVGGQPARAQAVAVRGFEFAGSGLGGFPTRFGVGAEAALHAVGVVAAGVHPGHDGCARVKEFARHDDFIPAAFGGGAGARDGATTRRGGQAAQQQPMRQGAKGGPRAAPGEVREEELHGRIVARTGVGVKTGGAKQKNTLAELQRGLGGLVPGDACRGAAGWLIWPGRCPLLCRLG